MITLQSMSILLSGCYKDVIYYDVEDKFSLRQCDYEKGFFSFRENERFCYYPVSHVDVLKYDSDKDALYLLYNFSHNARDYDKTPESVTIKNLSEIFSDVYDLNVNGKNYTNFCEIEHTDMWEYPLKKLFLLPGCITAEVLKKDDIFRDTYII